VKISRTLDGFWLPFALMSIGAVAVVVLCAMMLTTMGIRLPDAHGNPLTLARQTEHLLTFRGGTCSATAVGPHTLLSASHCFANDTLVSIDGKPTRVLWIAQDGHDHTLVGQTIAFVHYVHHYAVGVQGEPVFVLGNPANDRDVYRKGYVSGPSKEGGQPVILYELPIFFGDSGAAIFDSDGRIVGVVAGLHVMTAEGLTLTFGVSRPLAFTASQWGLIR